jgi:hypothetical protein
LIDPPKAEKSTTITTPVVVEQELTGSAPALVVGPVPRRSPLAPSANTAAIPARSGRG